MRRMMCAAVGSAALFATLVPLDALAQNPQDFPQEAMKLILPFPAGSGTDGTARVLANEISKVTGQPVIVENLAGAQGFIATQRVAKAAPDGYALILTSNTHIANKFLFKKIPYEPVEDFKSITLLKEAPLIVITGANSPYKSLNDLTRKVKQEPGQVSYGSGNSSSRVAAELYSLTIGSKMLYVPYKGNPNALSDLLGGRVDVMFSDSTSAMPHIKSGKVRALAITSATRMSILPDVPTTAELGLPAVNFGSWLAVLAPAKTPDAVVEKLNALFRSALQTESVRKNFHANASEPKGSTRQGLDKFMQSELVKWGDIIGKAGIQPE
jgi:tripartite-type tricarboxylate transporter receptor subunit TctC